MSGNLLSLCASFPLLLETEFLGSCDNSGGSGSTENRQFELGESESADGVKNTREVLAIDEHFVGVAPVNNDDQLSVIFSEVNKSNSASLNVVSKDLKISQPKVGSSRSGYSATKAHPQESCHIPFLLLYYYIK